MNNKKGLSGIVTALILIVLVLVAAGIVWAVYNSLIKGSAEDIEFNEKCLGASLDVTSLICEDVIEEGVTTHSCSAKLERGIGSSEEFDGVDAVFTDGEKEVEGNLGSNILVKGIIYADSETVGNLNATEIQIKVYFLKEDETSKHYCTPIIYEKP